MSKESNQPTYSLAEMKKLVEKDSFLPTIRVYSYLDNHYFDKSPHDIVKEVFSRLEEKDFIKSVELKKRPNKMADVYVGGWYDDEDWYVKAFIEDDGIAVHIWSMCWDGSQH